MVNVTYDAGGNLVAYYAEGEEPAVYNIGDMAWIMAASAIVVLFVPALGFLYAGLLRKKNALSMLMLCLSVFAVGIIQWTTVGYSLTYGDGSAFIGNLDHFGLMGVLDQPAGKIPLLLYCFFQSLFGSITAVVIIGGMAERAKILPCLVFTFLWLTVVYCPIGWLYKLGDMDYAGGGPVHMTSGTAILAWSMFLGKRRGWGTAKLAHRPHSVSYIILGTSLLWMGWFAFNGGSELAMNLRSVQAGMVTNISGATGGLTWMFLDAFRTGHYSAVSFCSGVLAGLIAVTPAAGYIGSPSALAVGFVAAIVCNFATSLKTIFKYDDPVDGFALHGVGAFVGAIMTGFLGDDRVAGFDGYSVGSGWINKNYKQMGYQLAAAVSIAGYTFVVTYLLLVLINLVPGLNIRCTEEEEILGMDESLLGETAFDEEFAEWLEWKAQRETSLSRKASSEKEKEHGIAAAHSVSTV